VFDGQDSDVFANCEDILWKAGATRAIRGMR
jgi:hypothetical protein